MNRPLESGDICEVISGFQGRHSPNVGHMVTVDCRIYGAGGSDHWELGPIWRCSGDGICQLKTDGTQPVTGWADFAQAWLRRMDEVPPLESTNKTKAVTA